VVEIEGRPMEGLVDDSPVRAGEVIRVRTTGGGGWGSPLDRDPALVAADVRDGKVSPEGARDDYGVVLTGPGDDPRVDAEATEARRTELRELRELRGLREADALSEAGRPFFDRGPGFPSLSGGLPHAEVDLL
jgi:N-methylhydantoinase B